MINPYFEAKNFVLFHGDAIEILNQFDKEHFDLIIKIIMSRVFAIFFFRF